MSRTVSSLWVKGIADMLQARGLDVPQLFREAGMSFSDLHDADARFSTQSVCALWELAAALSGNPAIGLCESGSVRSAMFDVVGYAIMSSENLLAGMDRMTRFISIVADSSVMSLTEDAHGYWVGFEVDGGGRPVPRQRLDFITSNFLNFAAWIVKRDIPLLRMEIPYPEPVDTQPYLDTYRCRVQFGATRTRMLFSRDVMTLPLHTSNPVLAELHERCARDRLRKLQDRRVSTRVRELIVARLPHGDPMRDDIASALCMSGRTLQRRLGEEGTSFRRLVDDTRRALAEQYLSQGAVSVAQAADTLSFSDQSALFRACRRWFEMSPRQYRDSLLASASPAASNPANPSTEYSAREREHPAA